MRQKGVVSIGILGVIVISLSLAAFFLMGTRRDAVSLWALAFLLLSEALSCGGFIGLRLAGARRGSLFLNAGIAATLSLYFIATLLSALFAGALRGRLGAFILTELVILAVSAGLAGSILAFARRIARREEADREKVPITEAKRGGF